jgi:hypothetical protein
MRAKNSRYGSDKAIQIAGGGFMVATGAALTAFGITAEVGIPLALGGAAVLADGLQKSSGGKGDAQKTHDEERAKFRKMVKGAKSEAET